MTSGDFLTPGAGRERVEIGGERGATAPNKE